MGLETSPDTLLRLIREQQERQVPTPEVLGVDDFSFCRRRSYGAILIDLERRVPIDLLPIEKPKPSKSGGFPIRVCRSSAGIAEARLQMVPGKEHLKRNRSPTAGISLRTSRKA
jgi:hypothetical protein